jgi:hypothetical protein
MYIHDKNTRFRQVVVLGDMMDLYYDTLCLIKCIYSPILMWILSKKSSVFFISSTSVDLAIGSFQTFYYKYYSGAPLFFKKKSR